MALDSAIQKLINPDTAIRRFSKANTNVAVTITFSYQNAVQTFVLDTVQSVRVNDTSTLTAHPIVDGSEVADHMYKNPVSMTINGSFQQIDDLAQGLLITSSGSELANVQETFTLIKNEGIKCEIVKLSYSNETENIAFMRRSNMVLTSINWVENINSLDFTFDFIQAMSVEIMTIEKDAIDENLPDITFPATKDFTETLINWETVDAAIVEAFNKWGLFGEGFLQVLQSLGPAAVSGIVAGGAVLATAVAIGSVVAAICASNPVGWLVGAAIVILAAEAVICYAIIKSVSNVVKSYNFKVNVFKKYKSEKKTNEEIKRCVETIAEIHEAIKALNNVVQIYSISSNSEQEAMISIDNAYYTFGFTKNNATLDYSMKIVDMDDYVINNVSSVFNSVLDDYGSCTAQNSAFPGKFVYLVRAQEEVNSDLTNIFIVVSKTDPQEFQNLVTDIIKAQVVR